MKEPKDFSKDPGSYHWALVTVIYLFMHLFFSVNKFLLTTVNNSFS